MSCSHLLASRTPPPSPLPQGERGSRGRSLLPLSSWGRGLGGGVWVRESEQPPRGQRGGSACFLPHPHLARYSLAAIPFTRKASPMRRLLPFLALVALSVAVMPTAQPVTAADDYTLGPDSSPQDGVPKGKVTQFKWDKSQVFEGTVRDCWLYVPAQYEGKTPACVMVFQDGGGYVSEKGQFRVPVVFDNLIHKKEMPVTIGIFINPGTFPEGKGRSNRSFEYDTLSDQYARFLAKEILPDVGK